MYLKILRDAYRKDGSLHHAYLIQGEKDVVIDPLFSFLEGEMKFATAGNPDFQFLEFDSFGVADGRSLKSSAAQKALQNTKVFVATFNVMTLEAQNSLLKLFEEPTENTHFFLITPNIDKVLHTLRSRMLVLESASILSSDMSKKVQSFLKARPSERLVQIKDIVETKDKAVGMVFLSALEAALHEELHASPSRTDIDGLRSVTKAKTFINDRGSSMKLLLEHLALTVPKLD